MGQQLWLSGHDRSCSSTEIMNRQSQGRPLRMLINVYALDHIRNAVVPGAKSLPGDIDIIVVILDIFSWMILLEYDTLWFGLEEHGILYDLQKKKSLKRLLSVLQKVRLGDIGVCPHRLWNLAIGRGDNYSHFLPILDYLLCDPGGLPIEKRRHTRCSEALYVPATLASNATQVTVCTPIGVYYLN